MSSPVSATKPPSCPIRIAALDAELMKAVDGEASLAEAITEFKAFKDGEFDSRVYQIPQRVEVLNYFLWRQWDAMRNSLSSVAHSLYSQKELHGKNGSEQHEMLYAKGVNWNDYAPELKRGRLVVRTLDVATLRSKWTVMAAPEFKDMSLDSLIPENQAKAEGPDDASRKA